MSSFYWDKEPQQWVAGGRHFEIALCSLIVWASHPLTRSCGGEAFGIHFRNGDEAIFWGYSIHHSHVFEGAVGPVLGSFTGSKPGR